jgi:solute carrier family 25 (mitochondrial phosphate transporter), member 23/24/25/41
MQLAGAVREAARKGSVLRAFIEIGKQGGIRSYWRGNLPQVLRVLPYSATQLASYELLKGYLTNENGDLSVKRKLLAGAGAGMVSTLASSSGYACLLNSERCAR